MIAWIRGGALYLGIVLVVAPAAPLRAQGHHVLLDAGAGSLNPDDPFAATLTLRGSLGWALGGHNVLGLEYTRQSANDSEGADLGKVARHFIGIAWQHAVTPLANQERMKRQFLIRVGGGLLIRGTFPNATPGEELKNAAFLDAGFVIRYPFSARVAAVGTIEDAVGFLPRQKVQSYCDTDPYCVFNTGGRAQHNFGLFVTLQLRL